MTQPERPSTTVRNYTETRRIDRRLYQIGDIRLPFAPTFRAIGFTLVYFIIELVVYKIIGFEFSTDAAVFWLWVVPPPMLALFTANIRFQGKSFNDFVIAQLRFVVYRVRHWGTAKTKKIRVVAVLWTPTHPAYRAVGAGTGGSDEAQ